MPLDDIRQARLRKLALLKKLNINPYPIKSHKSLSCTKLIESADEFIREKKEVFAAGRILSIRSHGGSIFLHLEDESGKIQLFLRKDILGDKSFGLFKEVIDLGDFIETQGTLFYTKTKELTIEVHQWVILAKSLRPLPDKWHGLNDKEIRLRKRYLDFLTHPSLREKMRLRAYFIKLLRNFLDKNGFLEVETPILQPQAGGALARPFKTRLNALNIDLYLRIAPELYLKRLIVAGFEKIYEIGKNFRNEGIDFSHNPEFTSLEFYWAYCDYEKLMDFTEEMLRFIIQSLSRQRSIEKQFLPKWVADFNKPLIRLDYQRFFQETTGLSVESESVDKLEAFLKKNGIDRIKKGDRWTLIDEIFKKICLPSIKKPFFLTHHPLALSPLAKQTDEKDKAARFQLIIEGLEIINAYSELNDPLAQKERFEEQQQRIKAGEKEAHPYDKDFIEALEYGMPPTAGWGMGIDRLVALLTGDRSIKEAISFPLIRPKK